VAERLRALALTIPGIRDCSNISVRQTRGGVWIVCHCAMDGSLTVVEAHELGLELGRRARRRILGVERVTVHAEPTAQ
jgi:divalent metal cation (Fe/Co/Zn/Cd) transporter